MTTVVMMVLIGAMVYGLGTHQWVMAGLAALATWLMWKEER